MKPSITIKPARDNSRNRRREARKAERAEKENKSRDERKAEILEKGGLAAVRGEKAAELVTIINS